MLLIVLYNTFMAVYFFYGEEDYNIDLELEKMRSKLNQDFISMNCQVYDNPKYSSLINILRTQPMMFGDMLIIINAENYFSGNKNFFEESELAEIENALNNNPESLNIVFVVKLPRGENKKLDSRRKLYKILSKFNSREFPVYKTYNINEIAGWIKMRAKKKGISFNNDAVELFIEHIGNNLRQFDNEMDKLKLIAYPETVVSKEMVAEICVSNQDLFNFTELLMKGEKDRALLEFRKLLDKKHPLELISTMQTMLKKWIIIKIKSPKMQAAELSKLAGMHEYALQQTIKKMKNINISDLVKLKEKSFNAEYKIKSGEALDIVSEVECAIIG